MIKSNSFKLANVCLMFANTYLTEKINVDLNIYDKMIFIFKVFCTFNRFTSILQDKILILRAPEASKLQDLKMC